PPAIYPLSLHDALPICLAPRAIGIGAVPLALAALTRLALFAHEQGGGPLMLVPAGLGATATVLALVASLVLLPMRATGGSVTGADRKSTRLNSSHVKIS